MLRAAVSLIALLSASAAAQEAAPVEERVQVEASAPSKYAVTVYRNPEREVVEQEVEEPMNADWPQGYGMISETRTVTLPAGRSTILFEGVAEGMVAVSAIVTGLPGGTIEKNRNADLLSPAALVDGMLGNRVTITRTNPGSGVSASEEAIIRTRADGGIVLQTREGFEAVRCSGLPEKLGFRRVPAGLSAQPIYSIDTFDPTGGTYEVVLTYISWGFDWEANYVAYLGEGKRDGSFDMQLLSWLSIINDNGQSFEGAELLAVAGTIQVNSDFEDLADAPDGRALRLNCYPIGDTAAGSPVPFYGVVPPPPPPPAPSAPYADDALIVVTGSRRERRNLESVSPLMVINAETMAREEQLGDLKLYRVPRPVTVASNGMKQIAFLAKDSVETRFIYRAQCEVYDQFDEIEDESDMEETQILLVTKNEEEFGLGSALPLGELALYEETSHGPQLVAEPALRDFPVGQDIELVLGESAQVYSECATVDDKDPEDHRRRSWTKMRALLSNANGATARVRLVFGWPDDWEVRWPGQKTRIKDGALILEVDVPANDTLDVDWKIRPTRGAWRDMRD